MNRLRKGLRLLLVVILTIAIFGSACGKIAANPATETTATEEATVKATEEATVSPTTTVTPTEEALKPVDLIWYTIGQPQDGQIAINDAMSEITKEKINATIRINTLGWGEYNDKMKMMIAAGEEFDLCFTSSWANPYVQGTKNGAFVELDELLAIHGQNINKQIPAKYFNAVKIDGKISAIPNYQIFAAVNGLMIKKDLVEKYNLDVQSIKKIQDLDSFFEKVKLGEPDLTPLFTRGGDIPPFNLETGYKVDKATDSWNLPIYYDNRGDDLKVVYLEDIKERRDIANQLRDWYKKEYIRKDEATIKDQAAERKSGKYAAYIASNITPTAQFGESKANGYDVIAVPIAPAIINTTYIIATLTAVSRTSKNPERAVMLYDLILENKELYNIVCNGIEGENYTKLDDIFIEPIADTGYAPDTDWVFGNQFNAYIKKGLPADIWEKTIALNESAEVSALLGFTYNTEALKNEIAQVEAIYEEYSAAIGTGTIDINEYEEEMKTKLNNAGLQKIIDDVQNQINEWKKTN